MKKETGTGKKAAGGSEGAGGRSGTLKRREEELARREAAVEARKKAIEELIGERTRELEKANEALLITAGEALRQARASEEAEEQYRAIFENSPEGMFQVRPEGDFIRANPAAAHVLGYESAEEMTRVISDIGTQIYAYPEDREAVLRRLREDGYVRDLEIRFRHKNGGIVWVLLNVRLVRDESGNVLYHEGTSRNITERKMLEQELQFKNVLLSAQQEASLDGILVVDREGRILSFNRRFTDIFAIPREVMEAGSDGRALEVAVRIVSEPERFVEGVKSIYAHPGERSRGEITLTDGRIIDRYSSPMTGEDGRHHGRVWYFRDVTEERRTEEALRESERRYREFADSLPQIVAEFDEGGNFTYANRNAFVCSLYTREDVGRGLNVTQVVAPGDAARLKENIGKVLKGQVQTGNEYTIVRRDGTTFPAMIYTSPIIRREKITGYRAILVDITDRKEAEEALRQSETKYRTLLENIGDGVYILDRNGYFTFVNDVVVERSGRPREWFLTAHYLDVIHPESRRVARKNFEADMRGEGIDEPYEISLSYPGHTGGRFWVEVSRKVLRDGDRIVGIIGTSRDITSRRRMEEALRESEGKFRSLVERSNAGVYLVQDGVFRYANTLFAGMLGYKVEEFVDRISPEQVIHPEDYRNFAKKNIEARLSGEVESIRYEVRLITRAGSVRHTEAYGSRTTYQGRPAVIGTILDITERTRAERALRESEERFRSIFENSPLGIFQSTLEGAFIKANPALARMLGYASPRELIDSVSDIARQMYVNPGRRSENIARMLETDGKISYEGEFFRKDGHRWTGHLTLNVIFDESGMPHHLDGIMEDVTEKKVMEGKLEATMDHLRTLSRRLLEIQEIERRHIARELHDEIGQTLTALRISLKRAGRTGVKDPAASLVNEGVRMVDGLIKQVRSLSTELRPPILDDFGVTAALEWYIDRLAGKAGFTALFSTDLADERLSPLLEMTCFRIAQEALTNVARHARAREVRVDMGKRDGELHLVVRDDGDGFNVEKAIRTALTGLSFGLVGMRERASLAGGRLEFRSEPGKGTEVHAFFPLGPAA